MLGDVRCFVGEVDEAIVVVPDQLLLRAGLLADDRIARCVVGDAEAADLIWEVRPRRVRIGRAEVRTGRCGRADRVDARLGENVVTVRVCEGLGVSRVLRSIQVGLTVTERA